MKKYNDSTLMKMTKAELIEQLRCAEHNREVAEEALAQQAENLKDWEPVVHCKDCKHKGWIQEPCHGKSIDYCRVWDCPLRDLETNFCSYGERKNADENGSR